MTRRVLLVCLGNICRSAAAEGVLRSMAPDWQIESAGTGGWHVDDPPYGPMQDEAARRGYDLSQQRAQQVTVGDFDRFDLIYAMDAQNKADLENLRPRGNATLVVMFAGRDVPDPYYTRDFAGCLDIIEDAAREMISRS